MGTGPHGGILVHPADPALAYKFRHFCNVLSVYGNSAAVDGNAAADDVQHGSFSGAVAPYDRDKFMVVNGKIKILEQAHFIDCPGVVIFIDIFQFKHGFLSSLSGCC